jgi:hypothetical protein
LIAGQSTIHDVLRFSFNVVLDPAQCSDHYGAEWMNPDKICVATEGGRGPCYVRINLFAVSTLLMNLFDHSKILL